MVAKKREEYDESYNARLDNPEVVAEKWNAYSASVEAILYDPVVAKNRAGSHTCLTVFRLNFKCFLGPHTSSPFG